MLRQFYVQRDGSTGKAHDPVALTPLLPRYRYFGEPAALGAIGFLNSLMATILWCFGVYGYGAGIVCAAVCFYATLRSCVIYLYLSAWQNVDIEEVRAKRIAAKKLLASTGAGKIVTATV